MTHEIIIAGFGGQGILLMGQILAHGAMLEDKEVSWFPSYGPEMRGGTANCSVVIADSQIGSPVVSEPTEAIIMNQPSLDKFGPLLRRGGLLIINSSLVVKPDGQDRVIQVPANDVAAKVGSPKVANMVMLGAFLQATGIVSLPRIIDALEAVLPHRHHGLIPLNVQALKMGRQFVK